MPRNAGYAIVLLIAASAGVLFAYREEVTRLYAATTLFDPDRIVTNFSNMDDLFLSVPIPLPGAARSLIGESRSLPPTLAGLDTAKYLSKTATTSLLVMRGSQIFHESYYLGTGPDDLRISWSMAKSVLSLVLGAAVKDAQIDLDLPVSSYVTELAESAYEGVTVRDALNMASGVAFDEDYLDFWSDINRMGRVLALGGSMDKFAAAVDERARGPGIARQYVSIDTHVLAMVLRAATGRSLPDLVGDRLLGPLGLEGPGYYLTDGDGVAFALGGLNLKTRDYARIGRMVLDKGFANGTQLIPVDWIEKSTIASAPSAVVPDGFDYGFQWWLPSDTDDVVLARGIYGQYLWIDRAQDVVIVKTAAHRGFRDPGASERDIRFMRSLAAAMEP